MKKIGSTKTIIYFLFFFIFIWGCGSQIRSSESWVDYDAISKIKLGVNQNMIVSNLGEPILILADYDDGENIIYLYYNYHVKKYLPKKTNGAEKAVRIIKSERKTLLKFTFVDDELISWEEDNITLGMAKRSVGRNSGLIKYVNLIINIVLLGAVFGGS